MNEAPLLQQLTNLLFAQMSFFKMPHLVIGSFLAKIVVFADENRRNREPPQYPSVACTMKEPNIRSTH